jgi:adenosylmethionine-8-amino-7-oxononanoate aminotransferase
MSEALRLVPHSRDELFDKISELFKNRSHVTSITVDEVHAVIAIKLDRAAHMFNHPDMNLPLKRSDVVKAQGVITRINRSVSQNIPPTKQDSDEIYELIDLNG